MLEGNFYPDSNIFQTAMEQKDTYEGIFMENRELLEAIGTMDAFDLALTALLTDALLEKHLEDKNDLGPKK